MEIHIQTAAGAYPVLLEAGLIKHIKEYLPKGKRFVIVTDETVLSHASLPLASAATFIVPSGEAGKSLTVIEKLLMFLLDQNITRQDVVIAFGGGSISDLTGFAASIYMRGIQWVSIPTTMLAMVDAAIGGKTAIDFHHVKNSIGTFWPPMLVCMDTDFLRSLSPRLMSAGLAEAVKAGMIRDPELFALFEKENYMNHMHEIIERSLYVKKSIVEQDERESGLRRLLNFGHTFGHAYEILQPHYMHGECIGMGMMKMVDHPETKGRLQRVLERLHLPLYCKADSEQVAAVIRHDKKAEGNGVYVVQVNHIGMAEIKRWTFQEIEKRART